MMAAALVPVFLEINFKILGNGLASWILDIIWLLTGFVLYVKYLPIELEDS